MKKIVRAGLFLSAVCSLAPFAVSVFLLARLTGEIAGRRGIEPPAALHLALYVPRTRSSSLDALVSAARETAAAEGAALSVHSLDSDGSTLGMAQWTGAQGVIVHPDGGDRVILREMEALRKRGIPVVLVNHSIPSDLPWAFVGANNFDFGKKAGALVSREVRSDPRIVVVYSDKNPAVYSERELVEMGLSTVFSGRSAQLLPSVKTAVNPRDAENVVHELLRQRPEVNVLVFTDADDTIAGCQALIDLNLVGVVQVIGYGDSPEIRDYIRKGVLNGSLAVNPGPTGAQAVLSLIELARTGYTSSSVDTGIEILSRERTAK